MTSQASERTMSGDIIEGNTCLVSLMGEHIMVEILQVSEDTVLTTFPGEDYPLSGMHVQLEFHDHTGFNAYRAEVLKGPWELEDGLLLSLPSTDRRNMHRRSFRVPTDLTVQVREQGYVRRYNAALVNISTGGCLLRTPAALSFGSTIEVYLSLPGEPTRLVLGAVAHITSLSDGRQEGESLIGIRFTPKPDPEAAESITQFVWKRLRELSTSA